VGIGCIAFDPAGMNSIHRKGCFNAFLSIAFSEEKLVIAFFETAPTCAAERKHLMVHSCITSLFLKKSFLIMHPFLSFQIKRF